MPADARAVAEGAERQVEQNNVLVGEQARCRSLHYKRGAAKCQQESLARADLMWLAVSGRVCWQCTAGTVSRSTAAGSTWRLARRWSLASASLSSSTASQPCSSQLLPNEVSPQQQRQRRCGGGSGGTTPPPAQPQSFGVWARACPNPAPKEETAGTDRMRCVCSPGGIQSAGDARAVLAATGCHAVMAAQVPYTHTCPFCIHVLPPPSLRRERYPCPCWRRRRWRRHCLSACNCHCLASLGQSARAP